MAMKRNGLGRNLSALLGTPNTLLSPVLSPAAEPAGTEQAKSMALDLLQPGKYQPRSLIDDESLQELAASIKQQGLLQPIVIRAIAGDRYEIIAGERRWRACRLAGLTDAPVIIRNVDDETAMAMALVENLQREDLNPMDQARAMARLVNEFSLTHQQIADLLCKSRTAVSNFLRLMSLSEAVMRFLEYGDLDMGHARALLMLEPEQQQQVAALIVAKNLSVRETEKLVKRVREGRSEAEPRHISHMPVIESHIEQLGQMLRTRISLKQGKRGKGSLVIHYDSAESLEELLQQMMK
ncbi:ParB/RepB/Spo0J family partition protein [Legionella sp. CNM-4043-24]|uniref:ParB/RepB/Spo0J family partition protein n=1 Tax=Legionella sp. CNM-4043-24 TaxID=3421646 RepID=UPI00403A9C87